MDAVNSLYRPGSATWSRDQTPVVEVQWLANDSTPGEDQGREGCSDG